MVVENWATTYHLAAGIPRAEGTPTDEDFARLIQYIEMQTRKLNED